MMSTPRNEPEVVQINRGPGLRAAGRDYVEYSISGSLKVYLATTPMDRLDEEAIDNERLFHDRFGIDVPRATRAKVIAIKRQHCLSDAECRRLRSSGQLRVTRNDARLVPDRLIPISGWIFVVLLSVSDGMESLVIATSTVPAWKHALAAALLLLMWAGPMWYIKRYLLEPFRWIRPIGASPASEARFKRAKQRPPSSLLMRH
jgi:hypothetical protein